MSYDDVILENLWDPNELETLITRTFEIEQAIIEAEWPVFAQAGRDAAEALTRHGIPTENTRLGPTWYLDRFGRLNTDGTWNRGPFTAVRIEWRNAPGPEKVDRARKILALLLEHDGHDIVIHTSDYEANHQWGGGEGWVLRDRQWMRTHSNDGDPYYTDLDTLMRQTLGSLVRDTVKKRSQQT